MQQMDRELRAKTADLERALRSTGGLTIAFSGGVDSTFLAAVAVRILKERVLAVNLQSPLYPEREQAAVPVLARQIGVLLRRVVVPLDELPVMLENPIDRCYHCKREVFGRVLPIAAEHGLPIVADGTHADDTGDYRPGRRAAEELGVVSPLLAAGFGKADIRAASRLMQLPTAELPSCACLATRVPFGEAVTAEKLQMIDAAEAFLWELGFRQVRVRHHGEIARIEVEPEAMAQLADAGVRAQVLGRLRELGFRFVALDLSGYRTGSMNPAGV